MRDRILIFVIALAGGLSGANVQPALSGLGKIFFPETSPPIASPASIGASSGALTLASGGSNQNLILTPSGTGTTLVNSPLESLTGGTFGIQSVNTAAPSASSGGALFGLVSTAPSAADQRLGFTIFGMLDVATTRNSAGIAGWSREAWTPGTVQGSYLTLEATATGSASRTKTVYVTNTGVSVATGAVPAYPLDVGGDVNSSGVFRKGGTAGTSATYAFPCSGSLTTSGGITTAATSSSGGATGALTLTLSTQTIQYKDWSSVNQSATVVTNVTLTTNSFTGGCRTL